MMWRIFELVQKHERREKVIRLRNKWVPVDPRTWTERFDLYVNVGIGTGNKQATINGASLIGQFQQQIVAGGGLGRIVTESNIYNLAREISEAIMPKKGDLFFTDPAGKPPPEPKPDEKVQAGLQKAAMMDKTKRDVKAIDFMTELMRIEKTTGIQSAQLADAQNQRQADAYGKAADQQFEREQQMSQQFHESQQNDNQLANAQASSSANNGVQQSLDALAAGQSELLNSAQQLNQALAQLAKIMSAKKKIITDSSGEPIGVEPILDNQPQPGGTLQ
jgi:hypothetical protein